MARTDNKAWNITTDAKDGDILAVNEYIFSFKSTTPFGDVKCHAYYNKTDGTLKTQRENEVLGNTEINDYRSATEEEKKLFMKQQSKTKIMLMKPNK